MNESVRSHMPKNNKQLHVAILGTRGIPAAYGGFETFAEQLAVRLVQRGYAVTVYAEADGVCPPDITYKGVRVRYRRRPRWGPASVVAYDCSCLWDARREFDLAYMLGYGAAWACWLPRVWGTPVWINVDGLEWVRSKWGSVARLYLKLMESIATRSATRLVADAEAIAKRFREHYPRGAQCITIAYGADVVDPTLVGKEHLSDWGLEPEKYFLIVARPEPENHILEMIEGYLSHNTDWPLVVVGDIIGSTNYQRRLKALRSERVRLIGAIYDHQKLTALRVHTALYLHGHSVGGTNPSLLEAMACGNLVLAHDNIFNREVAGNSASYFKIPSDLSPAIHALFSLSQDSLLNRRQQLQKRVQTEYSWELIANKYVEMIEAEVKVCQAR